jgi:hypothetical protein
MIRNKYYFTRSQGPPGPEISGPVTFTDNEMVRFSGVQGDLIKGSFWIQDDDGFVYNKDGDSLLKLSNSNAPTFCIFIGDGAGTQDLLNYQIHHIIHLLEPFLEPISIMDPIIQLLDLIHFQQQLVQLMCVYQ